MNDVKIAVGGAMEEEASRRFVDAWRRAERGEIFHERHLAFESWDALARVMTGKRMELLHYVRRHKVASVRALAKALGRDYSNVHADVQALTAAGLLDAVDGGLQT
jgi:predicted transcriptional regulator